MLATAVMGLLATWFAYLSRYQNSKNGLKYSFFLIFLFLALRYNFGNDYQAYFRQFIDINGTSETSLLGYAGHFEWGWNLLCRLFKPFGFYALVAVLAMFNCHVFYRFIHKYVPPGQYWLAVFLYVFSPGFMLIQASAMRQSVAINLFIYSIPFLVRKDAIRYFLCVGLASLFHTSALILLPVYLAGLLNWKINKPLASLIAAAYVAAFIFIGPIGVLLSRFVARYFERYEGYSGSAVLGSGLGLIYYSLFFILTLYYAGSQQGGSGLVFKIAIMSFMFIPLSFAVQLIGRVGMYFTPATIAAYPIIHRTMKKPVLKTAFIAMVVFITAYSFVNYFRSDLNRESSAVYHTILSADRLQN